MLEFDIVSPGQRIFGVRAGECGLKWLDGVHEDLVHELGLVYVIMKIMRFRDYL